MRGLEAAPAGTGEAQQPSDDLAVSLTEPSKPQRNMRKAQDEVPETPPPHHRSNSLASRAAGTVPLQREPPTEKPQAQESPAFNAVPTTAPAPPSTQRRVQELQLTPRGSERRSRARGLRPYARCVSHRALPKLSTPRPNNDGSTCVSGTGGRVSGLPGSSAPWGETPSGDSCDRGRSVPSDPEFKISASPQPDDSVESIPSEPLEPGGDGVKLNDPGFLLAIISAKALRFTARFQSESEPLRQRWQVANFLTTSAATTRLRMALRNVREDGNREVAFLFASRVLESVARSKPGRLVTSPVYEYGVLPYASLVWGYQIDLDEEVLTVHGPTGEEAAEVNVRKRRKCPSACCEPYTQADNRLHLRPALGVRQSADFPGISLRSIRPTGGASVRLTAPRDTAGPV